MAFKWLNWFNDLFGDSFKKSVKESASTLEKLAIELQDLDHVFDKIQKESQELAKAIAKSEKEVKAYQKAGDTSSKAFREAKAKLDNYRQRAQQLEDWRLEAEEKKKKLQQQLERELEGSSARMAKRWRRDVSSIEAAMDDFATAERSLREELARGTINMDEFADAMSEAQMKKFSTMVKTLFEKDFAGALHNAGNFIGNSGGAILGDALASSMGPAGRILGETIGKAITAAYDQVFELNNALKQLERSTGGVATAASLGYDSLGNATNGFKSLSTAAIEANITVAEFGTSIQSLFGSGTSSLGQIAGLKDNLAKSGEALQDFGIEAAQIKKYFGADIGPAAQGMIKNFGLSIKDTTKLIKGATDQAVGLGLSVGAMVENLHQAVDLIGDVYFRTAEEMSKLATLASELGTNVNSIAKGVNNMRSITDLFAKQQQTAALGLSNVSKSLSKVYALRKTGRTEEAASTELVAFTKDLKALGGIDLSGNITTMGIETLQAAGATQEQIQTLQRMGKMAEEAGVSLEKMIDPTRAATEEEKRRIEAVKKGNMTLEEQFNQTFGKLKQIFIDPIAKVLGPIIKAFMSIISTIMDVLLPVFNILQEAFAVIWAPIQEIIDQVVGLFHDIFDPLAEAFGKIQKALSPVFDVFKKILTFVVKFVLAPIRWIGQIIGKLFGWIGDIVSWFSEKLSPVFEWIGDIFESVGEWVQEWILDPISAIGEIFDWLASVPPLSWFGSDEPDSTSDLTPDDWKTILNLPENADSTIVPKNPPQQNITPTQVEQAQATAYTAGSDLQAANEEALRKAFMAGQGTNQTNVTVNVDPLFGNKQTVKNN